MVTVIKGMSIRQMKEAGEELARLTTERGGSLLEAEASSTPAVKSPEARIKTYKSDKDFQKDAEKMMRDGWHIEGQAVHQGKVALGRTMGKAVLTGGIGLALSGRSRKGDKTTVTWIRGGDEPTVTPAPPGPASGPDKYDQLQKLAQLKSQGVLSEEEFQAEKAKVLGN